jgi:hypothetical protein
MMTEVEGQRKNRVFEFEVSEESRSSLSKGSAECSQPTATGPRSPLRYSGRCQLISSRMEEIPSTLG